VAGDSRILCPPPRSDWDHLLDVASGSGASALLAAGEMGASAVGVEYGADAVRGAREAAQLELAARHVSAVKECREARGGRLAVRYGRFDWTAPPPATESLPSTSAIFAS
jgi:methylase of polypeptide subunit release factors